MVAFRSNDEFLSALRALIDRLCDERRFAPLAKVIPAYLAYNGLGDGWYEMLNALKAARGLGPDAFSDADWNVLNDLIHVVDLAVCSRSHSD
jgi:hypothetical protein